MTRPTKKEEAMGMTEAPFSMTFKMLDESGMSHLITMRAPATDVDAIMEVFQARDEVTERLTEGGWKPAPEYVGSKYSGGNNNRKSYGKSSKSQSDSDDDSDGDSKSCRHGRRVKKSGTSKKGPWTGYFCKARECDPVWSNDDDTADF
jgi:hypothetical protein